ncbi:Kinesin [Phytophthora palmivora]|uniref:Kinesin n=1 Tax=Phytophthora palmivora TaxID=4796 RepID=A0A2P4Y881_9STRA|nr:Kinesin [Phytophthora palmivora]
MKSTRTDAPTFPAQFTQEFKFDCSFWSAANLHSRQGDTQNSIYNELGVLAVQTVLQGHNCSVFAYGQAGAGKTYTMMGSGEQRRGLIPRILQGIFAEVEGGKRSGNTCSIVMSYVEIYDERVYDLLSQASTKTSLKVREHPEDGAFVERAQRAHVTNYTQALEMIEEGNRTRSMTSMHNNCRSHTVVILSLTQRGPRSLEMVRSSKICMVDLAGSERVDHGASGARLREVASVNRSLTTLADVVGALAKRKSNRSMDNSQQQKTFVPYRNSVLTRLLKESLGGRSKIIMIGVISPCSAHYEDSIATLRYIERAKSVNNTVRFQADTNGDMTQRFLGDTNALKSKLCVANEASIPPTISNACCGSPETNDECLNSELLDLRLCSDTKAGSNLRIASLDLNMEEISDAVVDVHSRKSVFLVKMPVGFGDYEHSIGKVLRESLILLKLVGIRRRWQTLRQCRAFDQWRKLVCLDATTSKKKLAMNNVMCGQTESFKSIGRKPNCPPLPTHLRSSEIRSGGQVHDVVETVAATDAICCSVVQDFLFPHQRDPPELLTQQSNNAASASLLELLASSSEFDRCEGSYELNEDYANCQHQLEELASPEGCKLSSVIDINAIGWTNALRVDNGGTLPLLSPQLHDEKNLVHSTLIHSTLSLCVDSIDLARRALGPSMCKLHFRSTGSGTGVECELLRYLDKRFLMITRILEDLVATPHLQNDDLRQIPSRSTCEILETMIGEFCLQIIVRLCDQLPSASSACVAGRLQLEAQLEHFSDGLKRKFLPEIARSGDNPDSTTNVAFYVATEMLVMTERIKLVWNLAGYQKRERLVQAQALEATAINDRKKAARIAALEERNSELSARCDTLLAASTRPDGSIIKELDLDCSNRIRLRDDEAHSAIVLDGFGNKYDGNVAPRRNDDILVEEVARTREVQAQNDKLLCRIATLKHTLATRSARVAELEAENCCLNSELQIIKVNGIQSANFVNSMDAPVYKLQKELENSLNTAQELESQLVEFKRINVEQTSDLESAKTLFLCEKARKKVDGHVALLRRQIDEAETENLLKATAIENLEFSLSKAQTQREIAGMLAEDSTCKQQLQTNQMFVLETQICKAEQRLLELESSLTATVQERDENILLHSQTEDALVSAIGREKILQDQLDGISKRELKELTCVRTQLHDSTLELASLREELTELLDHSTLQSATIETLKLEQSELRRNVQELEVERDELLLRCQTEQDTSEQKEIVCQVIAQQYAETLSKVERQLETERLECMTANEILQRQKYAFQELQALEHLIRMDNCSTIRDLKEQVETLSAETRALNQKLTTNAIVMEAVRTAAAAQIQELEDQSKLSISKHKEIARIATENLQECRVDLQAITRRWIQAQVQCGLLRICAERLGGYLSEAKESCMMQLADVESSRLGYDTVCVSTHATSSTELTVSEHLNNLDAWFDEVISGKTETTISVSTIPENTDAARSSLLKTLTDLGDLTNELLVVCEGTSGADTYSHKSPTRKKNLVHRGKGGLELKSKDLNENVLNSDLNVETQKVTRQEKTSDEVIELRKIVTKLKEALEAKDDMLLFLDGKVRRLEQGTQV